MRAITLVVVTLVMNLGAASGSTHAQCVGQVTESFLPPSVDGMQSTDPGFLARYWAWNGLRERRGGSDLPFLVDVAGGMVLHLLDWSTAEHCLEGGSIRRTAVLFESLDSRGYGQWALVNLGADPSGDIDVDASQEALDLVSSLAVPVPTPWIEDVRIGINDIFVELGWSQDLRGEALSDLVRPDTGERLPSVRGYSVRIINGPAATARPWDWSFGRDTEPDAVNGYSTDTHATIRMPRGIWYDVSVCFALALTFDGDGDADGERPESRSVHGEYLGAPSPWIGLPSTSGTRTSAIEGLDARRVTATLARLRFEGVSEPVGVSYRVRARRPDGELRALSSTIGGPGTYLLLVQLPSWCVGSRCELLVEMMDATGRVIHSATATL